MSRALEQFDLHRTAEGGICVRLGGDRMFVYPNDRYLSARLLFAMADALLRDAEAAPEPAAMAGDNGPAIDMIISPRGGVRADFSSDKTCRAFAQRISKFKDFGSNPATAVVDAGALADLLSAADALIERWHTPLWKDATPTAEYIAALRLAAESARKLLAGGE